MLTARERERGADVLKAIAHPLRLGILELLARADMTVGELQDALQCSQSMVSQQLRQLRGQGLVSVERDGRHKRCSLANRDFLKLFDCLSGHLQRYVTGFRNT